jgi:hypothetical protein
MAYYQLMERSNVGHNPFVADMWDLKGVEPNIFLQGVPIKQWPKETTFISSKKGNDGELCSFIVNNAMVPLLTPDLADFLANFKLPSYELLPTNVVYSTQELAKCFILNFSTLLPGFDEKHSIYEVYPNDWSKVSLRGKVWIVTKIVLTKSVVNEWDLFRCSQYSSSLFASEKFFNSFKMKKMRGVSFNKVETC